MDAVREDMAMFEASDDRTKWRQKIRCGESDDR